MPVLQQDSQLWQQAEGATPHAGATAGLTAVAAGRDSLALCSCWASQLWQQADGQQHRWSSTPPCFIATAGPAAQRNPPVPSFPHPAMT